MNRECIFQELGEAGNQALTGAAALALGAGLMYLLDPERGRRRRGLIRDKLIHSTHQTGTAARKTGRYMRGQARGMVAGARSRLRNEQVSDGQLEGRVCSIIGRVVSHPGSIQVLVNNGVVMLRGPILADEVDDVLYTVCCVRGVEQVRDELEPHRRPGDVPGLQGHSHRPHQFGLMQHSWSPTARLLMGVAGGTVACYGACRRDAAGVMLGLAGLGVLVRSLTNMDASRLTGIGAGRRAVEVQKTININAPVEKVFDFWTHYGNFPHFMSNVREVRDHGNGRSHWVVAGPAGIPVSWEAEITQYEPNRILAWKSIERSIVENAGIIHFQPNDRGGTRVHIQLAYNPPGGALGHALARVFGADPKSEMDSDLVRVKTMLETGHPPHDAAQPLRSDLGAEHTTW
jgi:uncharacterized membrane protein